MKLRVYAAVMTEIVALSVITAGMWLLTQKDLIEILVVAALFSPIFPLMVMGLTEQPKPKRRCRIYTLVGGVFHEEGRV